MLQLINDRLIEVGLGYVKEMNVGKKKVMSMSTYPVQIMIDQKQLNNVEYLNYLGSLINYVGCTFEIKFGLATKKSAFNYKKNVLNSEMDFNLRKKPVNCYT
jgi:hypothetical protein